MSEQREQIARKQAALENDAMQQRVLFEAVRGRRDEVAREVEQFRRSLSLAVSHHRYFFFLYNFFLSVLRLE